MKNESIPYLLRFLNPEIKKRKIMTTENKITELIYNTYPNADLKTFGYKDKKTNQFITTEIDLLLEQKLVLIIQHQHKQIRILSKTKPKLEKLAKQLAKELTFTLVDYL